MKSVDVAYDLEDAADELPDLLFTDDGELIGAGTLPPKRTPVDDKND